MQSNYINKTDANRTRDERRVGMDHILSHITIKNGGFVYTTLMAATTCLSSRLRYG